MIPTDPKEFDKLKPHLAKANLAFYASEYLSGPPEPPYNGRFMTVEHHEEWADLVNRHKLLCINAARDHGKSPCASTYLTLADGRRVQVKDVADRDIDLVAFDVERLTFNRVKAHVDPPSVPVPCVRVKTRTGRAIDVTKEHPLLTWSGWVEAQHLEVGTRIAVPSHLSGLGEMTMDGNRAWLLGLCVGDGCLTNSSSISKSDLVVQRAICAAVAQWGWSAHCTSDHVALSKNWERNGDTPLNWLEHHGLRGSNSYSKRVPEDIFRCSDEHIAEFISGYIDSDCHINSHDGGSVEFYSVSLELMRDVQHLLTRLGVIATLSRKNGQYKGQRHQSWRLALRGKDLLILASWVRPRSEVRAEALRLIVELQERKSVTSGRCIDCFPKEAWDLIEHNNHWFARRGLARPNRAYTPTRAKLLRLAVAEDNEKLRAVAEAPILWDEIVEITDIGNQPVYPVHVPGPENYVANDIINHNSFMYTMAYPIWMAERYPGKQGFIFSASQPQAELILTKLQQEIENNPRLAHLMPDLRFSNRKMWSTRQIRLANGHEIYARGYGTKIRGVHPIWVVLDDVLNDDDAYSDRVRQKNIDYYYSAIRNTVVPGGQIIVIGCVTPDAWVATADGLQQIGELCPGPRIPQTLYDLDLPVLGRDGYQRATKFWVNGECRTKVITLEKGFRLECSEVHPVLVMGESGVPEWRRAEDLEIGDYVGVQAGAECWGPPISLVEFKKQVATVPNFDRRNEIDLPDVVTPDLAYFLGLWTAEGSFESTGRVAISNLDQPIRAWLSTWPFGMRFEANTTEGSEQTMRASALTMLDLIKYLGGHLGKAPTKRVPTAIMRGPRDIARAFLQGYFDGDGNACVSKGDLSISSCSTSERLSRDVQQLLLNFGIVASLYKGKIQVSERVKNPKHNPWPVTCTGADAERFAQEIGFRLPRKQVIAVEIKNHRSRARLPAAGALIRLIRKEKPDHRKGRTMGVHAVTPPTFSISQAAKQERIGTTTAEKILNWFKAQGAVGLATSQLESNINEVKAGRVWLPVKRISNSRAETVDFVVPVGHSFLSNGIVSHNTPFSINDLYGELAKNKDYFFKRYPAILDEGTIHERALWPERYSLEDLKRRRREIGNIRFAREQMCNPQSDDLTLFPGYLFRGDPVEQMAIRLGQNYGFWSKNGIKAVFFGIDFAVSSTVAADYTVVFVLGLDDYGNRWVIDIIREKGLPFAEQKSLINTAARKYNPQLIYIESNQCQRIFGDELIRLTDLPVKLFHTGDAKHSLEQGIPALKLLLENKKFRIPRGDAYSVEATDAWIDEMRNISYANGRVVSTSQHDDTVMACWIANNAIAASNFSFDFKEQDGDAEVYEEELQAMDDLAEEEEWSEDAFVVGAKKQGRGRPRTVNAQLVNKAELSLLDSEPAPGAQSGLQSYAEAKPQLGSPMLKDVLPWRR